MSRRGGPTRRALLAGGAALAGTAALGVGPARAGFGPPLHGLSVFRELNLPPDYTHLAYVNPDAPRGGTLSRIASTWAFNQNPSTFNTLNTLVQRGDAPAALDIIHDSLMRRALDEPDAVYGLLAESVAVSDDGRAYRFKLRQGTHFHDGSALTAHDVAFTLETLKAKGHAFIRQAIRRMDSAQAEDDAHVVVRFAPEASRSLPQMVAILPIVSRTYYETRDFEAASLEKPLGCGPYKVGDFEAGRFIEYTRAEDYWGRDLAINRGQNNFDVIRYEFFRDRDVAFEAFKSGDYRLREEFTSRVWATGYDFPAVADGKVRRETLPDERPSGAQGWFINIRRQKFADPRVREALILAFDFEWSNKTLFYGLYQRTASYFQNSDMMASGAPSPDELALLEPFRGKVAEEVFGEPYLPPVSDGSGRDRRLQRAAAKLLNEAGYRVKDGKRLTPTGEVFRIEFLDDDPIFDRVVQPYIQRLKALGIDARSRTVDAAQFRKRLNDFDFDLTVQRFAMPATPGEEVRTYWTSDNADVVGSRNLSGIKDPVIDALTQTLISAANRAEQVVAARALDRVLRAGRYWVPHWYKPEHTLAYWDIYSHSGRKPKYGLGLNRTWWYDADKAQRIGLSG